MNDETLKMQLRELAVPAPESSRRERAWHRARAAFVSSARQVPESPVGFGFLRGVLAVATVFVAGLVFLGFLVLPARPDTLEWSRVAREMEALFPNQLSAVIERGGALDVALSDDTPGPPGQPVLIEFRRGPQTLRVLGFSGRRICLDLGGTKACFEPLVTGRGTVVLSGETFFWSLDHPVRLEGFRVQARPMPSA